MATKTLKHEGFTKKKRSKVLNLMTLPVRDVIFIEKFTVPSLSPVGTIYYSISNEIYHSS